MYIKLESKEKVVLREIKQANANISFPKQPTDEVLLPLGYANLVPTAKPDGDVVTEGQPEQDASGQWHQTWNVRQFMPKEVADRLEQRRADKLQEINAAYEAQLNAILQDYPEAETKTWDKQESEARAWMADNTASTPLLSEITNARGMSLAELVPRVIAKADAWIHLSGAATGKRQALEETIDAATTIEQIDSIAW